MSNFLGSFLRAALRPKPLLFLCSFRKTIVPVAVIFGGIICGAAGAAADSATAGWGSNGHDQPSDGATMHRRAPVAVNMSNALAGKTLTRIASGAAHTCVLTTDGGVYCWGQNGSGQLGDSSTTDRPAPVAVNMSGALAGKTVTRIAAGAAHTCVLTADGGVYCWGRNGDGQLGDGSTTARHAPVAVNISDALAGKTVTQIAAAEFHSCAATSDGGVYCWGENGDGQLGDGSTTDQLAPAAVNISGALVGKTITRVAAGLGHTCVLTADGGVYCWGWNVDGQLGDGSTTDSVTPVAVSGALGGKIVTEIAAGWRHSCAMTSDGGVYCWGEDNDGSHNYSATPVLVSGALAGKTVIQITTGPFHNCAATSDGSAYCWDWNASGELGDGSTTASHAPVAVNMSGALAGKTVTQIGAGSAHTCAMTADSGVYCWGSSENF